MPTAHLVAARATRAPTIEQPDVTRDRVGPSDWGPAGFTRPPFPRRRRTAVVAFWPHVTRRTAGAAGSVDPDAGPRAPQGSGGLAAPRGWRGRCRCRRLPLGARARGPVRERGPARAGRLDAAARGRRRRAAAPAAGRHPLRAGRAGADDPRVPAGDGRPRAGAAHELAAGRVPGPARRLPAVLLAKAPVRGTGRGDRHARGRRSPAARAPVGGRRPPHRGRLGGPAHRDMARPPAAPVLRGAQAPVQQGPPRGRDRQLARRRRARRPRARGGRCCRASTAWRTSSSPPRARRAPRRGSGSG